MNQISVEFQQQRKKKKQLNHWSLEERSKAI